MADDEADGEYEDAPGAVSSQKSRVSLASFSDPSVITKTCTWTQVWSGIDEDWHGWQLTIAVYLHLYQLIILGLCNGMKRLSRHSSFEALIEKNRGSSGRRRSSVRWRWNDGCCSLDLPEGRFMHKTRARKPFHSNSSPRHQLLRSPSLTTQSCK